MAKTFKGIDVSQYQHNIDFKKVKASGSISLSFVQAMASTLIRKTHISRGTTRQQRRQAKGRCLLVQLCGNCR